ncbi:hypothetical protein PR001_g29823 [Phytophthora rubi]|uniref:MAGE domain-containing protein n=1 Tax=Phytophthora rubi TaxID=129364 RepID=A0A6A3GYZ3_9STRA|nr:hypothetical protein PR002_g29724 [Phytophthora rubi]KAE8962082.1 hypothetical protein PR001_g29823 [Phytophthora rubi]
MSKLPSIINQLSKLCPHPFSNAARNIAEVRVVSILPHTNHFAKKCRLVQLDFTQTDYVVQRSQAEPPGEDDDEEGGSKKANKEPTMPKAVQQLSDKALDELTIKLVRYMLYKGGLKLPIKFAEISTDVFPQECIEVKYFFYHAKQKIENVFGYRVVQAEDSTSKKLYLVLNNASSQEHLLLMNKTGKNASRGFLMMVLGLLWCAPARQLSEGLS